MRTPDTAGLDPLDDTSPEEQPAVTAAVLPDDVPNGDLGEQEADA